MEGRKDPPVDTLVKLFQCDNCGQPLYFENTRCERCGSALGYVASRAELLSLEPAAPGWRAKVTPELWFGSCANARYEACNWLVPADSDGMPCPACQYNRTVPDLSDADNLARFRSLQRAKHRLFYALFRWGLRPANRIEDPQHGLAFDFLAEQGDGMPVMTGHADGLITISAAEAESAECELRRCTMGETYRTLLGHFRHESGHFFWDTLVSGGPRLDAFRALFGDERRDYGAAVEAHYKDGPPVDWQHDFVSAYATTHPWEDFAETWAHLLHIVDTLETASAFGIAIRPAVGSAPQTEIDPAFDPYCASIDDLIERWLPLAFAVNSLNRSMGQPDLYPFVLSDRVIRKLVFVRSLMPPPDAL